MDIITLDLFRFIFKIKFRLRLRFIDIFLLWLSNVFRNMVPK